MGLLATITCATISPSVFKTRIQAVSSVVAVDRKQSFICQKLLLLAVNDSSWCTRRRRCKLTASYSTPAQMESKLEAGEKHAAMTEKDLLVIGAGTVGSVVAHNWLRMNPGCKVVGVTATTKRHDELNSLGILPALKEQLESLEHFPFVIFCAPPYGSENYAADVRSAAERWNGLGSLLFTSSSAVYNCEDNGPCDESTTTFPLGANSRADKLLKAEEEVLKAGGNVVRLAGLYSLDRGPHTYYLRLGIVDSRPDHILNLINIEDAASLCLAILEKPFRSQIFMGCDDCPLSRQELMDLVNRSGKYEGKFEKFTGVDGPLGKRMDNSLTRNKLGWQPKYRSFADFLSISH